MTCPNPNPDACICGRQATGIGIAGARNQPWKWLCRECLMIVDQIKEIRVLKPFERMALPGGMNAAAPIIERYGSSLDEYTEEQAFELVEAIWRGVADEMRALIQEGRAPF